MKSKLLFAFYDIVYFFMIAAFLPYLVCSNFFFFLTQLDCLSFEAIDILNYSVTERNSCDSRLD